MSCRKRLRAVDALLQTTLDTVPFGGGDHAGKQIRGDNPLRRLLVGIDRERDALMQEGLFAGLLAAEQFF